MRASCRAPALKRVQGLSNQFRSLLHEPHGFLVQHQTLQVLQLVIGVTGGDFHASRALRSTAAFNPGPQSVACQKRHVLRYAKHAHHAQIAAHRRGGLASFHCTERHARETRPLGHLCSGKALSESSALQPLPQLQEKLSVDDRGEFGGGWHM